MSNGFAPPSRIDYTTDEAWRQAMQTYGVMVGQTEHSAPLTYTGLDDATAYSVTIENQDAAGKHLNVPNVMQAIASGVTVNNLVVSGTLAAGATTLASLHVTGATTLDGNTTVGDAGTDTLTVNAVTTAKANVTIQNTAGTVLAAYVVTAGAQSIKLGNQTTPGLFIDATAGLTLVGTATAPTANNDIFDVVGGRTYLSPNSEELALGLRYVSTGGSYYLGATNSATPDLTFKDNSETQRMRLLNGGGLIVGAATTMVGSELLLVKGGAQIEGATTITSGGITVTGTGTFNDNTVLGSSNADTLTVNAAATFKDDLTGDTGTFIWKNSGNNRIEVGSTGIGLFGAAQVARPTVTGVRTGTLAQLQTVVANLLAALDGAAGLGAITDSTT